MISILRQALTLLSAKERRQLVWLTVLAAIAAIVQTLSILAIMPFIALLANPELLQTNELLQMAYSVLGAQSYVGFLTTFGLIGIAVLTVGNAFLAFEYWLAHRFLCLISYRIEKKVLRRILAQTYEQHTMQHSAKLSDIVLNQVERVVDDVIGTSLSVFSNIVTTASIVAMLLVISLQTTVVTLVGLFIAYMLVFLSVRRRLAAHGEAVTALSGSIFTHVQEVFDGIQEIKSRKAEDYFARRYERSSLEMSKLAVRSGLLGFLPHFVLETLIFSGLVGISLYFVFTTQNAGISISYIALYGIAIYRLVPALKSIFEGLSEVHHSADAVRIVLDHCQLAEHRVRQRAISAPSDNLQLKAVSYAYGNGSDASVTSFTLSIPANSSLCLYGKSGSGKTTVLNLLAGLLYPQSGTILSDYVELEPGTRDSWRRLIGYCPQSVFLFDDMISSNIAFGLNADQIDYERISEVAEIAQLRTFIDQELRQGYDSRVGERGKRLSGGQKQRLGIARALYHNPSIVLLDESFTGLDSSMRDAVLDKLFSLPDTTLVFSSHDPAVAVRCDKVAMIEQGRLLAWDTYESIASRYIQGKTRLD